MKNAMRKLITTTALAVSGTLSFAEEPENQSEDVYVADKLVIYASKDNFPNTQTATTSFEVTKEAIERVNYTTSEDVFRYTPSLLIRRRSVGDPNGALGIRGSNVFQSSQTMVFADGIALHNPVRTMFNGAPRWSLIAPNEVESADVLYGPYSAQYSGNAFGGVALLHTRMPDEFEAHLETGGFFQDLDQAGREELLTGFRTFLSLGNRFDKFSIYGFYNHLENQGQPLTLNTFGRSNDPAGTPVTGAISSETRDESPAFIAGDQGPENAFTDLFKLKMAYDFTPDLQGRFNIAYEERQRNNQDPLTLLRDANGIPVFGGILNQGGQQFTVANSVFGLSQQERKTLNYALSLQGKISENWSIDTTASYFDAFKDRTLNANFNPADPLNDNTGTVQDVDTWWVFYDFKLATDRFLDRDDLSFMSGYQFAYANLNINDFDSNDIGSGSTDILTNDSGGQTATNSVFSQITWRFLPDWDVMAGVRYDYWDSIGGHVLQPNNPPGTRGQHFPDRDASRISPKASLGFSPEPWTIRYSFSKAYRFPIAEELFGSANTALSRNIPDPGLGPENGYFHDFSVQFDIPRGYIRGSLFYNQIDDEILNTTQTLSGQTLTTFLPIEQTETFGLELVFQQNEVFDLPVDLLANLTAMDKHITENRNNPALVGKEWTRIPKLLANATATYHILPAWDASLGVRYRSDSFQQVDNSDTAAKVMGGTDESTFLDFKTTYQLAVNDDLSSSISFGVDNILNEIAFEHHPYPQRIWYVSLSLDH